MAKPGMVDENCWGCQIKWKKEMSCLRVRKTHLLYVGLSPG
jgi:hypothetical protein